MGRICKKLIGIMALLLPAAIPVQGSEVNDTLASVPAARMMASQTSQRPVDGVLLQGVVTDTDKFPLPGVHIIVKETQTGVASDENGEFTILLPKGQQATVEFSFIGMQTLTKVYDGTKNHVKQVIVLNSGEELEEVVVTGLFDYNSRTFTGSAVSYTQEDLKSIGNNNVLKIIQSLDPAFIVETNSINGSNPNHMADITLRGNASFGGLQGEYSGNPNAPLFILDGFEASQEQIFDLDMNRVKSVTILKDGAAKAIYGSKASNGVIVVETILPEAGRLRVTYTGDLSVETPDLTSYNLTNAAEKLQVELNAGRYSSSSPYYQALLDEQYYAIAADIARGVDTYWLSQPLRTSVGQKHSASFEGGTEEMRYSAMIGYNDVVGVMKQSGRRNV